MKLKHLVLSAAAAACMLGGAAHAATVPSYTFSGSSSGSYDLITGSFNSAPYDFELVNGTLSDMTGIVTLRMATPISPSQTVNYAVYVDTDSSLNSVTKGSAVTLTPSGNLTDQLNQDITPYFTFLMQAGKQYVLELTGASSITGSVTNVSAVPLPGAIWLFGSALLGFLGFSNRRKI